MFFVGDPNPKISDNLTCILKVKDTTRSMFHSNTTSSMVCSDTTSSISGSIFSSDTTSSMFHSNTTSTINSRCCSGASRKTETCNIPLFQSEMLTCYSQVHPRFRLRQSTFLSHSSLFLDLHSKIDFCDFMYVFLRLLAQFRCFHSMSNPSTLFSGRPFEASEDAVFGRALQDDVVI